MFRTLIFLAQLLMPLAAIPARGDGPVAVPVDGPPFAASLAGVEESWKLTFQTGDAPRTMEAAELVRWGTPAELRRAPVLVMADGSLIVAAVLGADKEKLHADSDLLGVLDLPLEAVAGIVFRLPADNPGTALVDRIAGAEGDADRVILLNGDRISGRVERLDEQSIRVATDVGSARIELYRVEALVFSPALARHTAPQGLYAVAALRDGSRLVAQKLWREAGQLVLTAADGSIRRTPAEQLVFLEPRGGRAVYLSDLKPASYRHVPYLDLAWPYHRDRNVTGGLLRAGGQTYLKGLGVHSAASLAYDLDRPYRRFQAELAMDDSTAGLGSVRFRVFVDDQERFTSPTLRGGSPPLPVSVELGGAKRLRLVVDFADRADEMDRADWLSARLVP